MKIILFVLLSLAVTGCASTPRTKWTDKAMRVMIDPDSVSEENYVQIQTALVKSGRFTIVDRARGMNAMKKEQERTQRIEEDRYADKEKWSHWGKMYGVGSIIVAHTQCTKEHSTFNRTKLYLDCRQFLSIVDSNTGEVFVAVEGQNDAPSSYDLAYLAPDWNEVVDKLVDAYPKDFKPANYAKEVTQYQDISAVHAANQRDEVAAKEELNRAPAELEKMKQKVMELQRQLEEKSVVPAQAAPGVTPVQPEAKAPSTPVVSAETPKAQAPEVVSESKPTEVLESPKKPVEQVVDKAKDAQVKVKGASDKLAKQ